MERMNKKISKELKNLAGRLSIDEKEMTTKYNEIATTNGIDLGEERQQLICLTLTRNYVRGRINANKNTGGNSGFGNNAVGFFFAVEPARDVMEWKRRDVTNKYRTDSSQALTDEIVAEVSLTEGKYEKTQVINGDWNTKELPQLPSSAIEVSEGKWIVPIDPVKSWASGDVNKRYGKPLPAEEWRLRAHFIGSKESGDWQYWSVQLKGDAAHKFSAETFRLIHLYGIFNEERSAVYGIKNKTIASLTYNDLLDEEDERFYANDVDMEDILGSNMSEYVSDLMELESYHETISTVQGLRLVVTDGIVSSMNLQVNEKTGNRVMWIEPVDANYGFEDEDIPESTPVWVPSHINIDFGVGSDVIIIGRTNQTYKKDADGVPTEELNPVTINLYGVFPRIATGAVAESVVLDNDEDIEFW
jgi:hypothetical protein